MARRRNDGFEQSSIIDYIFLPFRALWKWGSALASDDQIRDRQSNSVVSFLLFPIRFLFSWIVFLINSWAITRQVRPFLFGIPALMVVTGVSGVIWLDYYRYPNNVARSQKYFEKFLSERGPAIAQHFALKRVGLQPENLEAKFVLAENWGRLDRSAKPEEKKGDFLRMLDLMSYLADQNYLLGHIWFARFYLGDGIELSAEERAEKIESHLQRAVQIDPKNTTVKIALFDNSLTKAMRMTKEDPEYKQILVEAQEHLMVEKINERTGEKEMVFAEFIGIETFFDLPKIMKVLIELAELADSEKEQEFRTNQARAVLEGSQKEMYRFMQKVPGHEQLPQIWATLISSAIQLKEYSAAARMIEDGERQANNAPWAGIFGSLKTAMLMAQVNDLKDLESGEQFDQALEILGQGIMKAPADTTISNRLVKFIVPEEENGKDLTEQLKRSKSVNAPAVAHLLLGIHLVLNGDALGGQQHWRIAETQSPQEAPLILFSLTRSLVTVFSDKFENRGDVIALAIEHFPNEGLFYLLRGSDEMNQGQFRQAIPDLEVAIEKLPEINKFDARIQLALCFRELNERDKFDEQRRTLQSMVSRLPPSRRENAEEVLRQLDQ